MAIKNQAGTRNGQSVTTRLPFFLFVTRESTGYCLRHSFDLMHQENQDDSSDGGHYDRADDAISASACTDQDEYPSSNDSPDNAENDVSQYSVSFSLHYHPGYPAGYEPHYE